MYRARALGVKLLGDAPTFGHRVFVRDPTVEDKSFVDKYQRRSVPVLGCLGDSGSLRDDNKGRWRDGDRGNDRTTTMAKYRNQ